MAHGPRHGGGRGDLVVSEVSNFETSDFEPAEPVAAELNDAKPCGSVRSKMDGWIRITDPRRRYRSHTLASKCCV
jgi:hypothetical protein